MYGLVFEMDRNVFDLIKQDSGHASLDLDSLMVVLFTCASANWALLGVSGYLQRQQLQRTADHIEHLATHILTGKLDAEQCSKPVLDETKAEQSLREIGVAVAGFHKYVPSAVVHMMLQGTWSPRPYVEPIEATVFFLDICDFTTHTEDMDPDTLVMHLQVALAPGSCPVHLPFLVFPTARAGKMGAQEVQSRARRGQSGNEVGRAAKRCIFCR